MASVWLGLVLWICTNALTVTEACARVHTPTPVVLSGSPVSVSCSIEDDCTLTKGQDFHVAWMINNNDAPNNYSYQENNRTYSILIPSLTDTADITCLVCVVDDCQIVDGVKVKLGTLPSAPKNLTCTLHLTNGIRLLCQWKPVQEKGSVPTNYFLHTIRNGSGKVSHEVPPEQHSYVVPRTSYSFFFELTVYVTAVNMFGNATTEALTLTPMVTATLDPPEITSVEAPKLGCLEYSWSLAASQQWLKRTLEIELRLKTANQLQYKHLSSGPLKVSICNLLHGTEYNTTIRVKYSLESEWSEWSVAKMATTLMRAPTGRLDTWLKVNDEDAQLYWKPSKSFRPNGWNLSYIVELKDSRRTLCITQESFCRFNLPKGVKKVYVRVMNAAGSSGPTEVPVYQENGLESVSNVSVHSRSNTSVIMMWESPLSSDVTEYVLEWRNLINTSVDLSFTRTDKKNNTTATVTGLTPCEPYEISVYPKYNKGIGRPVTVMAYSSEKAPSMAPKLTFEIYNSHVNVHWDEIPLKDRNGFIRYTITFWDEKGNSRALTTEKTSAVVRDLQPFTTYNSILTVHTMGGSLNGTVVSVRTGDFGGIFIIPPCIGLLLLVIIVVFTCFGKNERVKMCLWPIIPDPANSSIRRWTTTDSLQGMPPFKEDKDPVLVYLSHFSLLDPSEKDLFKGDYVKESQWPHDIDSPDSSENTDSFQACRSYDRESVPYATVVFGGPYQSHSASPPAYVRSESTQPLLGADEPGSPPAYQNVPSRGNRFTAFPRHSTESEESEDLWEEFPMLRSLEVRNTDHV